MNIYDKLDLKKAKAICYSGFRDGQHPGGKHPSYEEIAEDLEILKHHWTHLRLYDCDLHAQRVLDVIEKEGFDFKVMLGAYTVAEANNFGCPWGGGVYAEETLEMNKVYNEKRIQTLTEWANKYEEIIVSLSIGNESCVDWTDHYIPVERMIHFAKMVKTNAKQAVTFCENYVPWLNKLEPLTKELDFISIHTYPVWEYKHIHEAIEYTKHNYNIVKQKYPDIPVVITEAGWATNTNGRGILREHVSEEFQKVYFEDLMDWTDRENILCYFFEAFDENWKGSDHPMEPEKHWGLFYANRQPKYAMRDKYHQILTNQYIEDENS